MILENGDAQLRYCRTRFWKVSTLRGVFEGADDEVRYIAATLKLKQAGWADGRTDGGRTADGRTPKQVARVPKLMQNASFVLCAVVGAFSHIFLQIFNPI